MVVCGERTWVRDRLRACRPVTDRSRALCRAVFLMAMVEMASDAVRRMISGTRVMTMTPTKVMV
jgi:hypothetical protein